MTKWVKTMFWETETFEELKEGEVEWFADIKDFPQYADCVFPFALMMGHPNFRRAREVVRPGFVGDAVLDDLVAFVSNTEIAVDRLDPGRDPLCLERGPTFIFKPLVSGLETYMGKLSAEEYRKAQAEIGEAAWGNMPFDMEMEPLFRDFRVRLITPERVKFTAPAKICFSVEAYERIAQPGADG